MQIGNAKIFAPMAQPWAPAWDVPPVGVGWAEPSPAWFQQLPGALGDAVGCQGLGCVGSYDQRIVDYIRGKPGSSYGALILSAALLTGAFALLADRARAAIAAWPSATRAQVALEAEQLRSECFRAMQAGSVTAEQCNAFNTAVAEEESEEGGFSSWLAQTFSKHGPTIVAGVATTVLAAVLLRAVLK